MKLMLLLKQIGIGRHMILETLFDSLFNQFIKKTKTKKELWDAVVKVFKGEGSKKFHVQSYREYKMIDNKSVVEQAKDFQKITDAITVAGMLSRPCVPHQRVDFYITSNLARL